jgi:hypothetical protein
MVVMWVLACKIHQGFIGHFDVVVVEDWVGDWVVM